LESGGRDFKGAFVRRTRIEGLRRTARNRPNRIIRIMSCASPGSRFEIVMLRHAHESTVADPHGGYLTRSDVERLLGVSPNTVTRWAREGRLPSLVTLGGHHRFDRETIEELLASLRREETVTRH
jgi:excisionase family DNA binding protein